MKMERKGNGVFTFLNFNYSQIYFTGQLGEPWLITKFFKKNPNSDLCMQKIRENILKPFLWKCEQLPFIFATQGNKP